MCYYLVGPVDIVGEIGRGYRFRPGKGGIEVSHIADMGSGKNPQFVMILAVISVDAEIPFFVIVVSGQRKIGLLKTGIAQIIIRCFEISRFFQAPLNTPVDSSQVFDCSLKQARCSAHLTIGTSYQVEFSSQSVG